METRRLRYFLQIAELKNFVWIFAKDTAEMPEDDGLSSRKLLAIKIARWSKLREKLEKARSRLSGAECRKIHDPPNSTSIPRGRRQFRLLSKVVFPTES